MKNSTRKVVILENITSPYIQQAIIVLNEYTTVKESKVICDAERIVNEYLRKNGYQGSQPIAKEFKNKRTKKNRFWGIASIALIFGSIAVYFMINK